MSIGMQDLQPFDRKVWLSSPTMHGSMMKHITEARESDRMSTVGKSIHEPGHIAAGQRFLLNIGRKAGRSCVVAEGSHIPMGAVI